MKQWENNVRAVTPYVPGEQPKQQGLIKLNTNENPYPPSPSVQQALGQMDAHSFRLYPDPEASQLTGAIADRYGVSERQVFAGVGSDDVLSLAFLTFFNGKKPILFPEITYSFYRVWATVYQIPFRCVPLDEQLHIRASDYVSAAGTVGGIVFPNPNAPTGAALSLADVEEMVRANRDVVVIVDEAYIDFGAKSALSLVETYDNLLVVQTFSKSRSMAGVRIGYAIGDERLIAYLKSVKESVNSYTMNMPSIVLGVAALEDERYFQETCAEIIRTRELAGQKLASMGFRFPQSQANFLFVTHPDYNAKELFLALRENNIYVRYFDQAGLRDYLRITIGTPEQMGQLIAFLEEYAARDGGGQRV